MALQHPEDTRYCLSLIHIFSMIPSYFIDDASLLHGTSSVNEAGGALGGVVKLSTAPAAADGFGLQYIQGIGMYRTFDEFLRLTWGDEHWQVSTRAVYQSSRNDYKYRNRDKKENIYEDVYKRQIQSHARRRSSEKFRNVHRKTADEASSGPSGTAIKP